jgi:hypothetical protein
MRHIERPPYHAFDSPPGSDATMDQLWRAHPDLIVGRFLVNTSFDSGFLTLGPEEQAAGWRMLGDLAHSPRIGDISQVPHDRYDEWLVFEQPVDVPAFETMVNYLNFTPIDFSWEEKRERFWSQVFALRPLHVLGENDGVYVVTRDLSIAERLKHVRNR